MIIDTAVVPVAGLGTRLLPATKSQPKEMLPVGRKPVVQYVFEELTSVGVRRIVVLEARLYACSTGAGQFRVGLGGQCFLRAVLARGRSAASAIGGWASSTRLISLSGTTNAGVTESTGTATCIDRR